MSFERRFERNPHDGTLTALGVMVVFPLLVSGYLAYTLDQGGAGRLWRDGLLIVVALLPVAYWRHSLTIWYGGQLAGESIQTAALPRRAFLGILIVQGLAHRHVPRPVRVAVSAIAIVGLAFLLTGVS